MKPRLIVAFLICIANLSTASVLFLIAPANPSFKHIKHKPAVNIQWGDC
jgi:hypothetical protein